MKNFLLTLLAVLLFTFTQAVAQIYVPNIHRVGEKETASNMTENATINQKYELWLTSTKSVSYRMINMVSRYSEYQHNKCLSMIKWNTESEDEYSVTKDHFENIERLIARVHFKLSPDVVSLEHD